MSSSAPPTFSLIIPFYNEAENIYAVLTEACLVMEALGETYELLAVDDGSTDATRLTAHKMTQEWPFLRVLAFDKNRGQAAALLDGLREAQGRVLITMDGDGQNDPADIPKLIHILMTTDSGMAVGVRANRKDGWVRKRMSRVANTVRQGLLNDGVRDSGCALKAFHREVCTAFIPIRTLYSFMPALAVAAGFQVFELEVNHRPRERGVSKYSFGIMLWRPLIDMLGVWWFTQRRFQEVAPNSSPCSC